MKRFISIIIASLLSVAVLFAGCASSSPDGGGNGGGDHNGNNGSDTEQVEIVLGAEELTLEEGDSYTLSVQIDGTEEAARWASSAASVATVSQDGKITAVSEGKAVITASVGDVSDSCTVTVEKAASVSLTVSELTLQKGQEAYLGEAVELTKEVPLVWDSSDESVVTVEGGIVSAVEEGTAQVSVSTPKGSRAECSVTVTDAVNGSPFKLNKTSVNLSEGEDFVLQPIGADAKDISYTVSDEDILSVSASGKVTALSAGYAAVTAEDAYGNTDKCYILVNGKDSEFALDADISEWKDGEGNARYAGYTLTDLDATGRSVTVYAVLKEEGLYFAGEASHSEINEGYATWYYNTNFEVIVTRGTNTEQKWVNGANNAAETVGAFSTVEDGDMYRSTFELFIPYDAGEEISDTTYARAGWAFKNRGEQITVERNGGETTEETDWWWPDLKCPTNMAEHWYIYADGLHAAKKTEPLPEGVFYEQNFDDTADGMLPDEWAFVINTHETAEVRGGRLYMEGVSNAPVAILNFVPQAQDYAVEFDASLEYSGNATRWTGLVLDYREDYGYWQAVMRQNGNVNIDWWNLQTKKWDDVNAFTTERGEVEYDTAIRIRVELKGNTITYFADGEQYAVQEIEAGRGQGKLGFSCRDSRVYFDNFVIKALEETENE